MANGNGNGNSGIYLKFFLGLLSTAVIGLFVWVWTAQSTLTKLDLKFDQITKEFDKVQSDSSDDLRQDSQLKKHWKLHNWARGRINELERKNNMPLSEWPDLE